ncbi:YceD family protein [Candidatus Neptunochlamydia vexilliferae]|uniref:DUF177 domain-containing protein n=1 Tax=Candidatus Neptunichlamydia vexilliferae TaxID=1651774 RepID=A0ABS0B0B7_9BACT|nr:hypothetical protein [Candidatus Neptunochlamydia vexilliferae]MBF5059828.1 hypothetical protein [Candidatus Neptunochlamydia vexilliferae]
MKPSFKIYVDRLSNGRTEEIQETLSPDFIDVKEKDLQFHTPVEMEGKAYLAEDHLVIQLKVAAEAIIPCSICNEEVKKKVVVKSFYHTEELENIRGQVYDYGDPLREAILLEVPPYVECEGKCPKREELKNYFSKGDDQFPFADLN